MRKLLTALCMVVLFLFVGCGKQVNNINDFSKFSDMKRETDKKRALLVISNALFLLWEVMRIKGECP